MARISVREVKHEKEKNFFLTFLKKTKDGKFAEVEPTSLEYVRISAVTEPNYDEDTYLFSYS